MAVAVATAKVAVIVVFAFSDNEHVPVPAQPPPDHPVSVEPAAGEAVRVTAVPCVYAPEQVVPQLIPDGELVIVPEPLPASLMVRVYC
jgi:hypothetical protein